MDKVLNEICVKCNYICKAKLFQQNFENWTSGNNNIDKFIQDTQLSAHVYVSKALEWIPYDRFYDIHQCIAKGKFGKIYRANWIDGYIIRWDDSNQNWKREGQNMFVILKSFNIPINVASEFMNKVNLLFNEKF